MRRSFVVLFIFTLFITQIFSQSIFDSSKSIFNDDTSVVDDNKNIINSDKSIFKSSKNTIDENTSIFDKKLFVINEYRKGYGTVELSTEKSVFDIGQISSTSSKKNSYECSYSGTYGKWIKTVTAVNSKTRANFVKYLSDWQWSQKEDFLTYSSNRAEREKEIELCYDAAIVKFGIGTAIIGTVWVVSWVVPGGQVFSVSLLVIAKATTIGALSGGAIGGITSAGIAYAQGKRGDELLYATINGATDGYLIGAITGFAEGTFTAVKTFSGAIAVDGNIYTRTGLVFDKTGKTIGKTIRFAGVDKADDIFYIGKNSTSVFDRSGKEVAKIAKYKDNFVLYNDKGRIVGYLKDGELVSYCDPSTAAIVKGQHRAQPGYNTTEEVKNLAKLNGQYNPKTGNFLDAVDGSEIIGTPELGHINGHEYTNDLQRAFIEGQPESVFREKMKDPSIYQLESVSGNRGHSREAVNLTIDSFRNVNKNAGGELWKALLMQ